MTCTALKQKLEDFNHAVYACIKCNCCTRGSGEVGAPGTEKVCPIFEYNNNFKIYSAQSYFQTAKSILLGGMSLSPSFADLLYQCTTCGACMAHCTWIGNDPHASSVNLVEFLRSEMVEKGFSPMPTQERFGEHIEKEHNPYLEGHKDRWNWLSFDRNKLPRKAEIAYFVGCTSSYRQKIIAAATANVFEKLGLDYTILWREGQDEWCCGSPLQRTGQVKRAMAVAEHNVEAINKAEAKRVVTSCAGCYRMLEVDYKELYDMNIDFEVIHTPQLLLEMVKNGELKLKGEINMKVTYHDPCHLGRHMGVYEEPRELLKSIPGIELVEMERNREYAWCCGSGGGVRSAYPDLTMYASNERCKEAVATGAKALISACPFCWRGLHDAIDMHGHNLEFYDVIELVEKAMK